VKKFCKSVNIGRRYFCNLFLEVAYVNCIKRIYDDDDDDDDDMDNSFLTHCV